MSELTLLASSTPSPENLVHECVALSGEIWIGRGNVISAGVSLHGPIRIGDNNYIASGVRIGGLSRERIEGSHRLVDPLPEDASCVWIGNRNMIFDNAVVHKPMLKETRVGNGVEIGAHVLVGHDSDIRNQVVLSPHVALGGYVTVGERANLGLHVAVHNRLAIGGLAMCGLGSAVVGHVRPAALVYGNPARLRGLNIVGLRRAGIAPEADTSIEAALHAKSLAVDHELGEMYRQYESDIRRWPNGKEETKWVNQRL